MTDKEVGFFEIPDQYYIDRDFIKAVIERFLLDTGVTLEEHHYLCMDELTDPHCNADASILYYHQLIEDAFSNRKISDQAKIYYTSRFIVFIMVRIYGDIE